MRLKSLLVFCLLFLSSPFASSSELKRVWKEKETFYAEWNSVWVAKERLGYQALENMVGINILAQFKVIEISPKGEVVLEAALGKIVLRPSGSHMVLKQLEGSVFTTTLNPEGKIAKIEGLDLVIREKNLGAGGPFGIQGAKEELEKIVRVVLEQMLPPVPQKYIQEKESWESGTVPLHIGKWLEINKKFTFQKCESPDLNRIDVSGTISHLAAEGNSQVKKIDIIKQHFKGTMEADARGKVMGYQIRGSVTHTWIPNGESQPLENQTEVEWIDTLRVSDTNPLIQEKRKAENASGETVPAKLDKLPKEVTNSLGMKLVLIPAGQFQMGATEEDLARKEDEESYRVEITRPFCIGSCEVTIKQFQRFVKETGYRTTTEKAGRGTLGWSQEKMNLDFRQEFHWKNLGFDVTENHPVSCLSWYDAKEFCAWLSTKEGKQYRLPTEAEWEYACRAGSKSRYHSGEDLDALVRAGNIMDESLRKRINQNVIQQVQGIRGDDGFPFTAPVGSFQPNGFGLYDMHGNVAEWCEDWFWYYPKEACKDPKGPSFGIVKSMRGGSFLDLPLQCTSHHRLRAPAEHGNYASGFRVVMSDEPAPAKFKGESQIGRQVIPNKPGIHALNRALNPQPIILNEIAAANVFTVSSEKSGLVKVHLQGEPETVLALNDVIPLEKAEEYFSEKIQENPKEWHWYLMRGIVRQKQGNEKAYAKDLEEALQLEPNNASLLIKRAGESLKKNDFAQVLGDYSRALEISPRSPQILNMMAWFLSTCPDEKFRDGNRAVDLAKDACRLTRFRDGNLVDSLAAAFAEAGEFDKAVEAQVEAMRDPSFAARNGSKAQERLEMYRNRKAYRQLGSQ